IPGTCNTLRALKKEKLLPDGEYILLYRAYLFMRQLESRMRIISNEATSMLSRDPQELYPLARRMGYVEDSSPAGQKLLDDYESFRRQIRFIFDKVLQEK